MDDASEVMKSLRKWFVLHVLTKISKPWEDRVRPLTQLPPALDNFREDGSEMITKYVTHSDEAFGILVMEVYLPRWKLEASTESQSQKLKPGRRSGVPDLSRESVIYRYGALFCEVTERRRDTTNEMFRQWEKFLFDNLPRITNLNQGERDDPDMPSAEEAEYVLDDGEPATHHREKIMIPVYPV